MAHLALAALIGAQNQGEPLFGRGGPTDTVLVPIALAEAAVIAVGLVVLFGHAISWTWLSARRRAPRLRARRELVAFLDRGGSQDLAAEAFHRFRPESGPGACWTWPPRSAGIRGRGSPHWRPGWA